MASVTMQLLFWQYAEVHLEGAVGTDTAEKLDPPVEEYLTVPDSPAAIQVVLPHAVA